jgi:hypothetical protein
VFAHSADSAFPSRELNTALGGGVSTYHVKLSTYGAGQSSFQVMLTLNKFLDLGDATIQCQKTKYQNLGVRGPNETSIEFKS